jgi:DNA-binding GntR family transcriptional regulator
MARKIISFPKIQHVTLRDKVVEMLTDAFFAGTLKPGDLIVERQLSRQLNIGTPAIREALFTLQEQGFVHRVVNRGTYVNKFTRDEVRLMYLLRTELELLALRWAKSRVTENDLLGLEKTVEGIVEAATPETAQIFYERDIDFHRQCWNLSGNRFLVRSLETLVVPLFAFVMVDSEKTVNTGGARGHFHIVNALRNLQEPEFTSVIRNTLSEFAVRAISSMDQAGVSIIESQA